MGNKRVFAVEELRQFLVHAFVAAGVPAAEGKIVVDNLIQADLCGIGSHGVSRVPIYLKRIKDGAVNPRPEIRINNSWPAVLSVDGDNGLGAVITVKALEAAIAMADKFGFPVVTFIDTPGAFAGLEERNRADQCLLEAGSIWRVGRSCNH